MMYKLLFLLFLTGCTAIAVKQFDAEYGLPQTQKRIVDASTVDGEFYYHQIKPILENRCVVCHGCYDAPCQLKLSSPEGIDRGLTTQKFFTEPLFATKPTRLFEDAHTTEEWRQKGFSPVLNERLQTQEANLQLGLLYKMLELKKNNPPTNEAVLTGDYDFSLDRSQICPTTEAYDNFAKDHPNWGMPFGLPSLSDEEFKKMEYWLAKGSKMSIPEPLTHFQQQQIDQWESFLNKNSNKHKLMSRYVYEHLFLAHLYFDSGPKDKFFTIIRSKTPPGQQVQRISTRRPYDDPQTDSFYYRIVREKATILDKTHIPYRMDKARMQNWQDLFIDADFQIESLPSYQVDIAANPFITFRDIPPSSRYQFLLNDSQTFLMGFIKGAVCRGEIALNAIDDRFWIFFTKPSMVPNELLSDFLAEQSGNLRLPGEQESSASILTWLKYSELQNNYLDAKSEAIEGLLVQNRLSLDSIWDGDDYNTNAALTVFRHSDNASVVQGLVGKPPKTAWVIGYPLFERIHYLLVAGFDPFGNVSHKLMTRLYMDFMRIEAEFNFVSFLPQEVRLDELSYWYRNADKNIRKYVAAMPEHESFPSSVEYKTKNYKQEFFQQVQQYLTPVLTKQYDIAAQDLTEQEKSVLNRLGSVTGSKTAFLPEVVFIRLLALDGKKHFYTLIHNRGYANVASLFNGDENRLPNEDDLTLAPGFIGSYPNVFWDVKSTELDDLISRIETLSSEDDYHQLLDLYGVRRTSGQFWALSDHAHEIYKRNNPVKAGLFDYNRLENR